jgi:hypothetical protein
VFTAVIWLEILHKLQERPIQDELYKKILTEGHVGVLDVGIGGQGSSNDTDSSSLEEVAAGHAISLHGHGACLVQTMRKRGTSAHASRLLEPDRP